MHIVLGLIGSIVSVLYLLDRLGVDIGWLNPRYWRHRRAWRKKYEGDPIYSIEDPIQIAAVLIVGIAKLEGDLSAEQKSAILGQFEEKFSLDTRGASELFGSAAHLLGAPQIIGAQLDGLSNRNADTFKPDQAQSIIEMIEQISEVGGTLSTAQLEFINILRSRICAPSQNGTWS
ncbi:MAG: TerB family tellurite resistance protein [Gammaproteobacteria bacterium]|nr:TerB family tellurite resistance protein [Gammaproteobacteria bacterium]